MRNSTGPETVDEVSKLSEAFDLYEAEYRAAWRPSSTVRMVQTCTEFVRFLGSDFDPRQLARKHVRAFRNERMKTCRPASVRSDLSRVRAFVNFMRAEEIIPQGFDPTFRVRCKSDDDPKNSRGFTREEESLILNRVDVHPVYHDWVRLGILVGLRPQEQAHLRASDYDGARLVLTIRPYDGRVVRPDGTVATWEWRPKTRKSRRALSVTAEAHEILARRKLASGNGDGLLFPSEEGTPLDIRNLRRRIKKLLPAGTYFRLDVCRHTFARRCIAAGWSIAKLSRYLGHCSVTVTEIYTESVDQLDIGAPPVLSAHAVTPDGDTAITST